MATPIQAAGQEKEWQQRIEDTFEWMRSIPEWDQPWYESRFGLFLIFLFEILTFGLILITTKEIQLLLGFTPNPLVAVPGMLYIAGAIGAFGYVFTRLFIGNGDEVTLQDYSIKTIILFRVGLTVIGALPLVFGVYVLAENLDIDSTGILPAAFLAGMFVRTFYGLFNDVADRFGSSSKEPIQPNLPTYVYVEGERKSE